MEELLSTAYFIYPLWVLARWTFLAIRLHSTLAANLARVGLRLSWVSGEFKPVGEGMGWLPKTVLLGLFDLVLWLLAPVVILAEVVYRVYLFSKKSGMPVHMKELRWKLNNVAMHPDLIRAEFERVAFIENQRLAWSRPTYSAAAPYIPAAAPPVQAPHFAPTSAPAISAPSQAPAPHVGTPTVHDGPRLPAAANPYVQMDYCAAHGCEFLRGQHCHLCQ